VKFRQFLKAAFRKNQIRKWAADQKVNIQPIFAVDKEKKISEKEGGVPLITFYVFPV
jgi:hypothetical protein